MRWIYSPFYFLGNGITDNEILIPKRLKYFSTWIRKLFLVIMIHVVVLSFIFFYTIYNIL